MISGKYIYQKYFYSLILFLFLFQSCFVLHKPFVATSYEPLTVNKKGDIEASASIRPLKLLKINATYALTDCIAVSGGYSGFIGLDNLDGSILYFKNYSKMGFYIGANYQYQSNVIKNGSVGSLLLGRNEEAIYNCEYNSPGLILGLKLKGNWKENHFLTLKTNYNLVLKYNYYYYNAYISASSFGTTVFNNENINYKIPQPSESFKFSTINSL